MVMEGKIPSQNLIRQVNPSAPSQNPGYYKPIIFDALTVLSALGAGYAYLRYLAGSMSLPILLAVLAGYMVLSTLQMFFMQSFGHRALVLLLEIVAFLGFFYQTSLKYLGIAAGLMAIFSLWGYLHGTSELANGLEIKFFKAAVLFLKKSTTAILFVLIVLYLPRVNDTHIFVSQQNFQAFYDWASGFFSTAYPQISIDSTFDNFAQSIALMKLKNNPEYTSLSPTNQAAQFTQASAQVSSELATNLGVTVAPGESTSQVFYDFIVTQLGSWKDKLQGWFLLVWALFVFFILRMIGFVFYLIVSLITFIIYQILLAAGFVHIIGESRTHETVVY